METARCGWPSHPATQVSLQMHAPCAIRHSKNRSTSHYHSQAYLTGSSTHASVHPSICTPVQPPHPNHAPPPQQISLRDHPMDPPPRPLLPPHNPPHPPPPPPRPPHHPPRPLLPIHLRPGGLQHRAAVRLARAQPTSVIGEHGGEDTCLAEGRPQSRKDLRDA